MCVVRNIFVQTVHVYVDWLIDFMYTHSKCMSRPRSPPLNFLSNVEHSRLSTAGSRKHMVLCTACSTHCARTRAGGCFWKNGHLLLKIILRHVCHEGSRFRILGIRISTRRMNHHWHKSSLQSMPQARNIIKHHGHARHPYPQLVILKKEWLIIHNAVL
jgi:hypothetical protein